MSVKKHKFWNIEIIVGIMATIVSICALVVSVTQTRIMREQQYAQVWPNLTYGIWSANTFVDSTAEFEFHLNNKGVGPAIIKDIKIKYKNDIFEDDERQKFFQKLIGDTLNFIPHGFGSVQKNKVMLAGEDHTMWTFKRSKTSKEVLEGLWNAGSNQDIDVVICYQNIYGQKWIVHNSTETEECKDCAEMQKYLNQKKK
jgi:hypothetical protein